MADVDVQSSDIQYSDGDDNFMELSSDRTGASGDLIYPILYADEIPDTNWINFTRKKFSKNTVDSNQILVDAEGMRRIRLPLPKNLSKSYRSEWSSQDMGIWGSVLKREGAKGADEILTAMRKGNISSLANKTVSSISDYVNSLATGDSDTVKGLMDQLKSKGTSFIGQYISTFESFSSIGGYVDGGIARNPYKAMMYSSPGFRRFNFDYSLMARNFDEAVAIRDMIREFHIGMSPSFEDAQKDFFNYPNAFDIRIDGSSESGSGNDFLFKFAPCVLEDFNVNYHGEGQPLYIKGPDGNPIPASVTIQFSMQETKLLTREDFEKYGY